MNDYSQTYYKLNGELKEFNNFSYLNEGKSATLYRKNNIVLKVYNSDCEAAFYITKKIFKRLRELNINGIVRLHDFYYHFDSPKLNLILPPDAYTMEYVQDDKINLLTAPKDYLLDSLSNLEKVCQELSINHIEIHDAHEHNIMFNNKGATLVDVDSYRINRFTPYTKLLLYNKKQLLDFIKSRIRYDYKKLNIKNLYIDIDEFLFNIRLNYNSLAKQFDEQINGSNILDSITKK